ncbi:MAG: phosphoglucomutase (alpha-D-glucose-1,6-bisphosphate-dependent) [Gemmatimonadota bacterium]
MDPLAGKPAPAALLIDPSKLESDYYRLTPDLDDPTQLVSFGTSGHRGAPSSGTFTETHILAISQAICEYRRTAGIEGPLFLGKDTHAASGPAERSAIEVLAANGVQVIMQRDNGFVATPVISRSILRWNQDTTRTRADGIVITPSHNPPADGGFKYNPPNGGPADTDITNQIQDRANAIMRGSNREVRRLAVDTAMKASSTTHLDLNKPYIEDLAEAIHFAAIRSSGIRIGVDPLGGSSLPCWEPIAARYSLDLTVVNQQIDPTFRFMTVDHDGKIRMDCSSPWAMASLVGLKDQFDVAFANDPDADRHGIVTPSAGLMNPNHFLAVAIQYLLTHRPRWNSRSRIGKTLVSSAIIDRVVGELGRDLFEVPVGFKWFAPGLFDGTCCFGGEESAGASFLKQDGSVWTTDKDGLLLGLLAAEITATTGKDPGVHYAEMTARLGAPVYTRIDTPCSPQEKAGFKRLTAERVIATSLAGDPIMAKLTRAPGNDAPIGGLKVTTANGWFAARPSGTENIYKIYAESFRNQAHLDQLVEEARSIVTDAVR